MNTEYCPIVVLKPSTSEPGDKGIYSTSKDLFVPTIENVRTLVSNLNDLSFECSNRGDISLNAVEQLAIDYGCNVLGGAFLAFLVAHSVPIDSVMGKARVESTDVEFMTALYPDLLPFFEDSTRVDVAQQNFAKGVVYNNTGHFKVICVDDEVRLLDKLLILKKTFRRTARAAISYDKSVVRDNLVHCPDNQQMLFRHTDLLKARFITQ